MLVLVYNVRPPNRQCLLTRVQHEKGRRQEIIVRALGAEPRVALLDGDLLVPAPRQPLLDAALDAITHACESLWSRSRSIITDALAEKALDTFLTRLPAALDDRDPSALQDIIEASSAANLACGNTGLALCHAMNTAPDVPLAHGYTNGCLLLAVAGFNRPYMDEKHREMIDRLPGLFEDIRWGGRFAEGEVGKGEAEFFVDASRNHPFRWNNVRESSGKCRSWKVREGEQALTRSDEECYELLRQSGATIEASA